MPSSPSPSGVPTPARPINQHAPLNPSSLRQSHSASSPVDSSNVMLPSAERTASPERVSAAQENASPTTRLLEQQNWRGRPMVMRNYGSVDSYDPREGFGGKYSDPPGDGNITPHSLLGDAVTDGLLAGSSSSHLSTTQWLAKQYGVKNDRSMYVVASFCNSTVFCSKSRLQVFAVLPPRDELDPSIPLEISSR